MGEKLKVLTTYVMPSVIMVFYHLLPNKWVQETMITDMNREFNNELKYDDFMMWIGMWFLM